MDIEILVEDRDGNVLHHRIGKINANYSSTRKAAYTRIRKRLMRVFPNWAAISIKPVEVWHERQAKG